MTTTAPPGLLEAVRGLGPTIRERAPEIDRERRVPQEIIEAMLDARLFHMYIPADRGGDEVDPVVAAQVIEEVSSFDGSAGWCVMIGGQNAAFAGFLSAEAARAVYGPRDIVCGTARPIGRAVWTTSPAEGYIVSGRWPFASGSSHATWFGGECVVYDGDQPRKNAAGEDVTRLTMVPREQVTIHDVWDTTGLRGTASNDFSIDGVFVPAERGFQMIEDPAQSTAPLYRAVPLVFMNHGSQSLGVARGALAEARAMLAAKQGWGGQPLTALLRMQSVIAEATVLVESARSYLYGTARELWEAVQEGGQGTALQRARVRLATSHSTRASIQAVDLLYQALATSAIMRANPLERRFRDIHTAGAHVMIGQMTYEAAGRVELGLNPEFPFF